MLADLHRSHNANILIRIQCCANGYNSHLSHLVLEGAESGGSLAGLGRGKGGGRAEDGSEAGGGLHVYERGNTKILLNCECSRAKVGTFRCLRSRGPAPKARASRFKAKDLLRVSFIHQIDFVWPSPVSVISKALLNPTRQNF